MAFHKTNLGSFGTSLPCSIFGYVPDESTGPWDLQYDHGNERLHDESGNLTEYGIWWQNERFPEIKAASIKATEIAKAALKDWQNTF